jgi:hypothetical protein
MAERHPRDATDHRRCELDAPRVPRRFRIVDSIASHASSPAPKNHRPTCGQPKLAAASAATKFWATTGR